jgi:hypothetical protein
MRDATSPLPADAELAVSALRYAAGDMPPAEAEAFEARLGDDQSARDALAEAVRLSAAASGLPDPCPDPLARKAVAERLFPTWVSRLFPRRPYRGHPVVWAVLGGGVAAVAAVVITLNSAPAPIAPLAYAGPPPKLHAVSVEAVPFVPAEVEDPTLGQHRPLPPVVESASNTKLNPMGRDVRGNETAGAAYPAPIPMALAPPAPAAPVVKPAEDKLAETMNDPNPMGDPHIGMMSSKL